MAELKVSLLLKTNPSSHIFVYLMILTVLLADYDVDGVQDVDRKYKIYYCQ